MRIRLATAAAVAGIAVAALPGHAATAPKPQITDPTGDANGVNGQGIATGAPSPATPADASAADIKSVLFQTTFKTKTVHGKVVKVPTGFTVTMTLAAAPSMPNVIYRVAASAPSCDTLFFEYSTAVSGTDGSARCAASLPATSGPVAVTSVAVKGSSVIWTVPVKSLPAGQTLSSLDAQTRFISGTPGVSLTAPQYDEASSAATFTIGK
jgi:hypothetical protein